MGNQKLNDAEFWFVLAFFFFHCQVTIHIKIYPVCSFEWVFFSDHGFNC